MKRMTAFLIMLSAVFVNYAFAGYALVIQPQITPSTVVVHGINGQLALAPNPGSPAIQPAGGTFIFRPANFSRYSTATANRKELWETPTDTELDANILAAMTGLKAKIAADVLQIRKDGSAKVSTDNAVILAIYDSNREAAQAVVAGKGDSIARDGTACTAYLSKSAAVMGMTVPVYAQWIIAENNRIGGLVKRIDDEYMRLFYAVIPAEMNISNLLQLPSQFRGFCGL